MLGRRARQSRASSRSRFDALLQRVELAKAELVAAVPSPRGVPGRPLAAALLAFEEGLREAAADLDRWPGPDAPVADCREAVDESLRRAERLRLQAPDLDHEGLLAEIAELLAPLDAFSPVSRGGAGPSHPRARRRQGGRHRAGPGGPAGAAGGVHHP